MAFKNLSPSSYVFFNNEDDDYFKLRGLVTSIEYKHEMQQNFNTVIN